MSNIVERLRDASYANAPSRCMEAAKEIERLQAALIRCTEEANRLRAELSSGIRESK
jgi:hypothetical protein